MIDCRIYNEADYQFLREMLYEAVFWSRTYDKPTLEEGLSYDYAKHILLEFGKRNGDIAVIAEIDGVRVGAAFIRYWNKEVNTRGYISDSIPVLVIGVRESHRRLGVGSALMEAIKTAAINAEIYDISLCVTKSNKAYNLYTKHDFKIVEEVDLSYNMLWEAQKS